MPKTRGRPKGSKNQPALFPVKKKEATFLSIPSEILGRITVISAESKYTKQQVLEDILKNGLFTVLKMYRGVIETRKALDSALQAEKEEHETIRKPSTRPEPAPVTGDSGNGLTEGQTDGRIRSDSSVPGIERVPAEPDPAVVQPGQQEEVGADPGEDAGALDPLAAEIPFE